MINQLSFMCETGVQRSAIGYPDSTNSFPGVLLCYNIMSDFSIKRVPVFPSSMVLVKFKPAFGYPFHSDAPSTQGTLVRSHSN